MRGGLFISGRSVNLRSAARHFRSRFSEKAFTVIEVVIVLAITGMLFVSAAVMISGRQNQTAFDQSIQQVQSQIQQALNEVATGYYPNNSNFRCSVSGGYPNLTVGSGNQGANAGCIFLGRALQFGIAGTDPERFSVYTIAGLKDFGSCSVESACLGAAQPMVVAPSDGVEAANYPDNSTDEELGSGLKVVEMWYNNGGTDQAIGALAFVNTLAHFGSSGQIVSGSGSVNVLALDGTILNDTKLHMAQLMDSDGGDKIANGTLNPSGGVFICFESAGTNDYGIVRIGGEKRELSVTLTTKDKGASGCK